MYGILLCKSWSLTLFEDWTLSCCSLCSCFFNVAIAPQEIMKGLMTELSKLGRFAEVLAYGSTLV